MMRDWKTSQRRLPIGAHLTESELWFQGDREAKTSEPIRRLAELATVTDATI
jgi:hypothetical protein